MNRKRLQPYVSVFEQNHIHIEDITITGSNHLKFAIEKAGRRKFFIAPVSGSDHCGLQNFKQDVRRWLRTTEQEAPR